MKFLILNTDYPKFLRWLYAQHPGLEKQSYATVSMGGEFM